MLFLLGVTIGPFVNNEEEAPSASGATTSSTVAVSTSASTPSTASASSSSTSSSTLAVSTSTSGSVDTSSSSSPSTTEPEVVTIPDHTVVAEEDVSFPGAVRVSLRVAVSGAPTPDQLRALAWQLANEYRASHQYQAFNIFFYAFPELAFDLADLGIWVDAPYGDWARAAQAARGDYSTFAVDEKIFEKDWTLLPSEQEVMLYVAFFEKADELDPDYTNPPSDEEVASAVAADMGFTAEDVLAATEAVLDWQMNGR